MTRRRSRSPPRRRYLQYVGSGLAGAVLAGCVDVLDDVAQRSRTEGRTPTSDDATGSADGETVSTAGTTESADDTTGTASENTATPIHAEYETTDVSVKSADGNVLGSVTAAIADTPELRYLGLSDTESLPPDRGMLFVYEEEEAERTFVMREMAFGIDIVFADAAGVITRIHHAPAPGPDEDSSEHRYAGRGQYVLEVVYEWTARRGIGEGDVLEFEG